MNNNDQAQQPSTQQNMLFMAYDGDNAGRMVGRAILANDPEALHEASERINHGHEVVAAWVTRMGGSVISGGGDEGCFLLPQDAMEDIEDLRKDYEYATQLTMTVGAGKDLSEAGRALIVGKFRGKNQVVLFDETVDQEIAEAHARVMQGTATPEEMKISESYLEDGEEAEGEEGEGDSDNSEETDENNEQDPNGDEKNDEAEGDEALAEDAEEGEEKEAIDDELAAEEANCEEKDIKDEEAGAEEAAEGEPTEKEQAPEKSEKKPKKEDKKPSEKKPADKKPLKKSEDEESEDEKPSKEDKKPAKKSDKKAPKKGEEDSQENAEEVDQEGEESGEEGSEEALEEVEEGIENPGESELEERDVMDNIDDTDLAIGHEHQDNASRPEGFAEQNDPNDMGMEGDLVGEVPESANDEELAMDEESEDEEEMDPAGIMADGLDEGADDAAKQQVFQAVAQALEGLRNQKAILERAKEQAPELYQSTLTMIKAMIEMAKMLGGGPAAGGEDPLAGGEEGEEGEEIPAEGQEEIPEEGEEAPPQDEKKPAFGEKKDKAPADSKKKDLNSTVGKLPTKKTTKHVARTTMAPGSVNGKGQQKIIDPTTGKTRWVDRKKGSVKSSTGVPIRAPKPGES